MSIGMKKLLILASTTLLTVSSISYAGISENCIFTDKPYQVTLQNQSSYPVRWSAGGDFFVTPGGTIAPQFNQGIIFAGYELTEKVGMSFIIPELGQACNMQVNFVNVQNNNQLCFTDSPSKNLDCGAVVEGNHLTINIQLEHYHSV